MADRSQMAGRPQRGEAYAATGTAAWTRRLQMWCKMSQARRLRSITRLKTRSHERLASMKRVIMRVSAAIFALGFVAARPSPRRSRRSRSAARSSAASARDCRASPIPTTRATGPASTSISAARSRRRSSTIRPRSSSRRCPPRTGSSRSSRARSTCCRATPPGPCRATSPLAISPA